MPTKNYKFDTLAIHSLNKNFEKNYPLSPPIYQTSTFAFKNTELLESFLNNEFEGELYTRGGNPTIELFERKMAELENGKGAVAFSSGMGAISSVIYSFLKSGDTVITNNNLYGCSNSLITENLKEYNVNYKIVDLTNIENLKKAIDKNTKLIYFETPSNPNLEIVDIKKIVKLSKENNIKVVIDNTFATPYFQNPLQLGVDVVVHSATKYICGHGDAIGGVAISNDREYLDELKFKYMCKFGSVISPFNAWLLLRGIKTLGLRMRQHEENALAVAKFLEKHSKIEKVMYPGLKSSKYNTTAKSQMNGFGAIISFEIKGTLEEAKIFVNSVEMIKLAVSLGECDSLVEIPVLMTHKGYSQEELKNFGIKENLIRLSVGIEDIEDIIADIDNALANI